MLKGILAGRSSAAQAAQFKLPLLDVERRLEGILGKIEARNTADAVRIAIYAGLTEADDA